MSMYCFVDPKLGEAFAKTSATPPPHAAQQTPSASPGEQTPATIRTPPAPVKPERDYTPRNSNTKKPLVAEPLCPHCNGPVIRIRRRFVDRVLSLFMPVQRYRCHMKGWGCDWEGNL